MSDVPKSKRKGGHSERMLAWKRKNRICIVFQCRIPAGPKKCRCNKHHAQVWDAKNSLRRSWINKKGDAKRKGRKFTITFPQWERMAREGGLLNKRGRSSESMSIDRKDNDEDYTARNSRVITIGENSSKGTREYLGPHWRYLESTPNGANATTKARKGAKGGRKDRDSGGDPF